MEKEQLARLQAVSEIEWRRIVKKLETHLDLRLYKKTNFGAHSEARLKMNPFVYYVDNAIMALYEGKWVWNHSEFSLLEQLRRIIDSMISWEVEKYKGERLYAPKTHTLSNPSLFDLVATEPEHVDEEHDNNGDFQEALDKACNGDSKFSEFVNLKREGFNYDDICRKMGCSKVDAYQMMETIGRRAKKILSKKK